jgi:multidrug efflux pump subunit AcrA (membrane-fusion protein)
MSLLGKKSVLGIVLACCFILGGILVLSGGGMIGRSREDVLASIARGSPSEEGGQEQPTDGDAIPVKTVRPRRDASFTRSVEQPAFVEAYYKADLMARVAGQVKPTGVVHDIGDRVKAEEALVQIDVPDLEEDVLQKESLVVQRRKELALAQANLPIVAAGVDAAANLVKVEESKVPRAESARKFREKELRRFKDLAGGRDPAVTPDVVDERTDFYEEAVAVVATARANVLKAEAGLAEAKAKLEAAKADVSLKDALIGVALKERDKARALRDYATVRAPFDGVITRRNVDPGSFVQNATTAHTDALFTVARTDIITVYMKVPDTYAPFVNRDTEAVIQMDALPGLTIRGKVTRYAPSVETPEHDRTMRVEVDLYNGSPEGYQALLAKEKAAGNADLKSRTLPVFPRVTGMKVPAQGLQLLPGLYGKMRLVLNNFKDALLLPSSAVFTRGGKSYVMLVRNGRAVREPVEVQLDNGKRVKLTLIEKVGEEEVKRELTGDEEVVVSNQGELSDGQAVKAIPLDR